MNMMMKAALFALPVCMVFFAGGSEGAAEAAEVQAIVNATVVDPASGKTLSKAVVIIEGERIGAVGAADKVTLPPGAKVIDAAGKWLLPGLINTHVQLALKLPGAASAALANETPAEVALRSAQGARLTLLAGTTTIRTMGEPHHATLAVDRAVRRGEILGPRIFSSGHQIAPTGGTGAPVNEDGVDGVDDAILATRREIRAGASWILVMITKAISFPGGTLDARRVGRSDMTLDELRAIVDVARRSGVRVAAHSASPPATLEALEAGVSAISHGYFLNEEVFAKMKQQDAWYVPTIVVSQAGALQFFKKIGSPDWYLERRKVVAVDHWKSLQTAIRMNVNIAMGTDQYPFEPNEGTVASVREIELYAQAGMTPARALRTATSEAAKMLGAEHDVGAIETGKYADMIMVTADPLADISALRSIGFVMKGGAVVRDDWALAK